MNKTENTSSSSKVIIRLISWVISIALIICLVLLMLLLQNSDYTREDSSTIRKVDLVVALPPPPPPIQVVKTQKSTNIPTINVIGAGEGPSINYSNKANLGQINLKKVELPEFDIQALDFRKTIAVDFGIVEVQSLDSIPKIISSKYFSPPRSIIARGIKRIPTEVELIIDKKGRAHIKKIVDPVYPEMIDTIRKWVKHVRFSVPKKNGQAIEAIYLYGLNFNYDRL